MMMTTTAMIMLISVSDIDEYNCQDKKGNSPPYPEIPGCLEDLKTTSVRSFQNVLMILPRPHTNKNYETFTDESRERSTLPPFNSPKFPGGLDLLGIDHKIPVRM